MPAIIPPVGGITELVVENENGFMIDSQEINQLNQVLDLISNDLIKYKNMSDSALLKINEFSEDLFIKKNISVLKCS